MCDSSKEANWRDILAVLLETASTTEHSFQRRSDPLGSEPNVEEAKAAWAEFSKRETNGTHH